MGACGYLFAKYPVWILLAYFSINAALRAILGAPPELDEAEQLAIATHYSFGYGPHPPLYQWIQTTAFYLFGVNYTAIAIPKNAILFGTYAMLYLLGMHLANNRLIAVLGAFGLLLSVNFAWESQHDQSHTVSNTFLTVTATFFFFKMLSDTKPWNYLLFGLCIGFWALAKYNFIFPLAAMICIAVFTQEGLKLLKSPWILVTVLIAISVPAHHYIYILENFAEATTKVSKLGLEETGFLQSRLLGILAFVKAFVGVHAGWLVLVGLWFLTRSHTTKALNQSASQSAQNTEKTDLTRRQTLFGRYVLLIYALLFVFVLIAGTTRYRDHWMQPAAVFAPLFLSICFQKYISSFTFTRIVAVFAIIMPIVTTAYLFNNLGIGTERRDAALPDPAQFRELLNETSPVVTKVAVSDGRHRYRWLTAGHLRSHLSRLKPVFEPGQSGLKEQSFWLIWRANSANLLKAKNIYMDLRSVDAGKFSNPVAIGHFRPNELGEFAGTKWWVSRYTPTGNNG